MARPATMTSRAGMMGMGGSRYEYEGGMRGKAGGKVRLATVASRGSQVNREVGVMERKK